MAKYDGIRDFINSRDVIEKSPNIKEIEKYLGVELPKSYYDKSYWNNKKCAIGKILHEMGLRVTSVQTSVQTLIQTTVKFEKITDKKDEKR